MQQFDGLVSPALANTEQTELHQTVGHQVVVEPDLLLAGNIETENTFLRRKNHSTYAYFTSEEPPTGLGLEFGIYARTGLHPLTHTVHSHTQTEGGFSRAVTWKPLC